MLFLNIRRKQPPKHTRLLTYNKLSKWNNKNMTSLNHLWNTLKNYLLFCTNGKITSPKTLPFTKPPRLKKYIHTLISIRQQGSTFREGKEENVCRQATIYTLKQRRWERGGGSKIYTVQLFGFTLHNKLHNRSPTHN